MKLTLTALTVAATMFASNASAFDPDDLQKLTDFNVCVECDLSGADLSGANLNGADLRFANLRNASLNGANLRDAYLWSTILSGADLERANLEGANLAYAYMIDVILGSIRNSVYEAQPMRF